MKQTLINSFMNTLITETLNGHRTWDPIYPQTDNLSEKNEPLYFLLFENEYHKVFYEDSYSLPFQEGFFYFVHEWTESGRDGTTFDGYNLYVQPNLESKITLLLHDSSELYRLKNAILEKDRLPEDVEHFISNFLEA